MDADYPAAHSMDTSWFAVDAAGHVAVFRSGEAGAVPLEAFAGDEAYAAEEQLVDLLPPAGVIQDPAGRVLPGKASAATKPRAWAGGVVVVGLTSLDPVQAALAGGQAVEVPATEGKAVVFQQITDEQLEAYHALPECLGSWNLTSEGAGMEGISARGLYVYDHLTENWISGPYGRESVPLQPIHLDQLPAALRRQIARCRFDGLRFADTPHVQPVELTECASWESAYLDSSGRKIGPIPGNEDAYADAYEEITDLAGEYEIQPPEDPAE